ncbi:hypothetical protein [Providencia alcalifaciens]|uniref:hypothetical protein n=1 Tax=Providencia alcalifaciens TaxID=126385 RepID=UPI002B054BE1|nr:hypothetical protein [Providencia alcalifaciens]
MNIKELKDALQKAIDYGVPENTPIALLTEDMNIPDDCHNGIIEADRAILHSTEYQKDNAPKMSVSFEKGNVVLLMAVGANIIESDKIAEPIVLDELEEGRNHESRLRD